MSSHSVTKSSITRMRIGSRGARRIPSFPLGNYDIFDFNGTIFPTGKLVKPISSARTSLSGGNCVLLGSKCSTGSPEHMAIDSIQGSGVVTVQRSSPEVEEDSPSSPRSHVIPDVPTSNTSFRDQWNAPLMTLHLRATGRHMSYEVIHHVLPGLGTYHG